MLDKKHYILIGTTTLFSITSLFAGYKYYTTSQTLQNRYNNRNTYMMMKRMHHKLERNPRNTKMRINTHQPQIRYNQQPMQYNNHKPIRK